MYISLYRKYRPQTFSDMVEQDAAVCILQNSLKNKKLGHAFFSLVQGDAERHLPHVYLQKP